jgi:AmmeMemoRadiSam system protein B
MKIRFPAVADAFYPAEEKELKRMISDFLGQAKPPSIKNLKALIVPHAGYVYSGPVAAHGFKLLEKQEFKKVIAVGPSHYAAFVGAAEDDSDGWQTPLGIVRTDRVSRLVKAGTINCFPQAHAPEHCLEVQLPFLQTVLKGDFVFYPLITGEISPSLLAEALEPALSDETLLLISSDLSHYFPYEEAVKRDSTTNKIILSLDVKNAQLIDACGKTGIITAMHIAKSKKWKARLLDYRNSGDTAGPKSNVVGYSAIAFYGK